MPYLSWISDKELENTVRKLLDIADLAKAQAQKNFNKNVVDPFAAIFEMAGLGLSSKQWQVSEEGRQVQKTLQNFIGNFHQTILGKCKGWTDMGTGNVVDLVNKSQKIVAEVKNKHNTVTGSNLSGVYTSLESTVMPKNGIYHGYTAYFVNIIPKKAKRFNDPFVPSNNQTGTRRPLNNKIRIIDGASFYDLVTGATNSLGDLFSVLPSVIDVVSGKKMNLDKKMLQALFNKAY